MDFYAGEDNATYDSIQDVVCMYLAIYLWCCLMLVADAPVAIPDLLSVCRFFLNSRYYFIGEHGYKGIRGTEQLTRELNHNIRLCIQLELSLPLPHLSFFPSLLSV